MKSRPRSLPKLFEEDDVAWKERNASLIRQDRTNELDFDNLATYLWDMADWDKRETYSRLFRLLTELFLWHLQPKKRTGSRAANILRQQFELKDLLESNKLRHFATKSLGDAYQDAVWAGSQIIGKNPEVFPSLSHISLDGLLSHADLGQLFQKRNDSQ